MNAMRNQNPNHNILDSDRIGNLLMKLTMPMLLGTIVQNVYGVFDTIFVGHYVGSNGIAALSICFPIQMLTGGVAAMVGLGGGSLVSRLIGGSDHRSAERALGNSILFSLIFSLFTMLVVMTPITFWLHLMGASDDVLPMSRDYLLITYAGTVFNILGMVLLMLVRAEGNARVPMICMVGQSLLNILLDWVFMNPEGLNMGVSGAALSMVISQIAALLYLASYYFTNSSYLKLRWRNFMPDIKIIRSIFAIGVSQFAQTITNAAAGVIMVKMISNYGGDMALSAFGIIQRIMNLSNVPGMVLGQAMQPIMGFNYGAKRYNFVIRTMKLSIATATICSILFFILIYAVPEPIIRIFTSDTQLVNDTMAAAKNIFIAMPLFGFFATGQMIFPSLGKAIDTFIIGIARPVLFLIPLLLLLPLALGINGVWYAFPGCDVLSFLMILLLLIPLLRHLRKPPAAQPEPQVGH